MNLNTPAVLKNNTDKIGYLTLFRGDGIPNSPAESPSFCSARKLHPPHPFLSLRGVRGSRSWDSHFMLQIDFLFYPRKEGEKISSKIPGVLLVVVRCEIR